MNIDELEKLARAADNDVHNIFTNPVFISKATPAAILELISINRDLVAALKEADDQLVLWQGEPNEFSCAIHYVVMGNIRKALARANGENNE